MSASNIQTTVQICDKNGPRWISLTAFSKLVKEAENAIHHEKFAERLIANASGRASMTVWPWFAASAVAGVAAYALSSGITAKLGLSAGASKTIVSLFTGISALSGFAWMVNLAVKHNVQF